MTQLLTPDDLAQRVYDMRRAQGVPLLTDLSGLFYTLSQLHLAAQQGDLRAVIFYALDQARCYHFSLNTHLSTVPFLAYPYLPHDEYPLSRALEDLHDYLAGLIRVPEYSEPPFLSPIWLHLRLSLVVACAAHELRVQEPERDLVAYLLERLE